MQGLQSGHVRRRFQSVLGSALLVRHGAGAQLHWPFEDWWLGLAQPFTPQAYTVQQGSSLNPPTLKMCKRHLDRFKN